MINQLKYIFSEEYSIGDYIVFREKNEKYRGVIKDKFDNIDTEIVTCFFNNGKIKDISIKDRKLRKANPLELIFCQFPQLTQPTEKHGQIF